VIWRSTYRYIIYSCTEPYNLNIYIIYFVFNIYRKCLFQIFTYLNEHSQKQKMTKSNIKNVCISLISLISLVTFSILFCPICLVSMFLLGTVYFVPVSIIVSFINIDIIIGILILSSTITINRVIKDKYGEFRGQLTIITFLVYLVVILMYKILLV